MGQHLSQQGTSLHAQLQQASPLAAVCAIKGLVSSLPQEALCCPMELCHADTGTSSHWQPLVEGALPKACAAMEEAADVQFKYHALQLLTICLQRIRKILQVRQCYGIVSYSCCQRWMECGDRYFPSMAGGLDFSGRSC